MIVGERIRQRLADLGMSQASLARRVGLRQSTINGIIQGEQRSTTKLHEIARELHTTPAWLSGETDDPGSNVPDVAVNAEEMGWIEQLRAMLPRDRDAVLQLTRSLAGHDTPPTVHSPQNDYQGEGDDGRLRRAG